MSKPCDTQELQDPAARVPTALMIASGALILLPWIGNALALNVYTDPALMALMHATRPFSLFAAPPLFLVWEVAWRNLAYSRFQKRLTYFFSIVMLTAFVLEQIYYYQH